jgi:hypothetical protein
LKELNTDIKSLVELDIDERITYLWEAVDIAVKKGNLTDLDIIGGLLRAAYGQGYVDALKEPRGKLQRDNGFQVPPVDESHK